jgi:16S rRNA (cytosine967-C5)-methyltransferase
VSSSSPRKTSRQVPRNGRWVARQVLERVGQQQAWATLALDAELRASGIDERERRLASELTYGVLRHQQRLDQALALHANLQKTPAKVRIVLRVAAYQLLMLDRVPDYAVIDDAVDASKAVAGPKVGGFVNAVLRKVKATGFAPPPSDPLQAIAALHSMPSWIVEQLRLALLAEGQQPESLADAVAALNAAPQLTLRANRRRITADQLIAKLQQHDIAASRHAHAPDAVVLRNAGDPSVLPGFTDGDFTIQDAAAQRVALLAAPRPGDHVLDACAGVGGKACQLAELQDDAGRIFATDLSATKLSLAHSTATRLGLRSVHTHRLDLLAAWPDAMPALYPIIVLDAPCTGLGVLRRHPDAKWRLVESQIAQLASLQQQMIDALWQRVAPGGRLVYSVCSFTVEEGPAQVTAALRRHPDMQLATQERSWPHMHACDAFYLAVLNKA